MTLRRVKIQGFSLPLRQVMRTAHGRIERRDGFLVEVEDEAGLRGFGEATPLPSFGTEELAKCREALEASFRADLTKAFSAVALDSQPGSQAQPQRQFQPGVQPTGTPCAEFAREAAFFDLQARREGKTLAAWIRDRAGLSGAPPDQVRTQALVAGDSPVEVAEDAERAMGEGCSAFKLKVAMERVSGRGPDLTWDFERVGALRSTVGAEACIRLDANEGWTLEAAEQAFERLASFGVDFVEQPVGRGDLVGLKRLRDQGVVDVAADESLQGGGFEACFNAEAASVWVVKTAALGGLDRSIEIARLARESGIRLVWSTLMDGAVSRGAAVALAAGLQSSEGVDEVHGLGTAGWLDADLGQEFALASGGKIGGKIKLRGDPGLGFVPEIPEDTSVGAGLELSS